ncbi:VWA domain-containing protein [Marichromatium gracile]|uniref:VWA domain-containing protein n=1 Tax=Marichromatium gracile TaxID=1048 RepID=UPI001F16614C|nr:VWA domain-containing protein [Marichromatium gracile]MCF1184290.1 VWA domain-containing protein [Marichromatium gracile]
MLEFHWPWAALALPLPWLLPRLLRRRTGSSPTPPRSTTPGLRHPHPERLRAAFAAGGDGTGSAARLDRLLWLLLWLALVAALTRPQWLTPHTEISTPGYDLMLAVDASHSMAALDLGDGRQLDRMQVVRTVMDRFVAGRGGDRVGLILFGAQAFVLAPLTLDRTAIRQQLADLVPGIAGAATALGDAIALGTLKLRERPAGSRVLLLIADGDNNAGGFDPREAARLAAQNGIRIHVIGVGSQQQRIPIREEGQIRYRDDLTMDEETLRAIAALTGGDYFRATDGDALARISAQIDGLEKTASEARTLYLPQPLYRWPLLLALAALLALGIRDRGVAS